MESCFNLAAAVGDVVAPVVLLFIFRRAGSEAQRFSLLPLVWTDRRRRLPGRSLWDEERCTCVVWKNKMLMMIMMYI